MTLVNQAGMILITHVELTDLPDCFRSPQEISGKTFMSGTYLVKSAVLWVSKAGMP